jgi:hypothetical protein
MQRPEGPTHPTSSRVPWNKGKFIGAEPPLRTKHVWSIRTKLQVEGRKRDLAMFNLAIDSKLRGCDVVSPKVETASPHGICVDRATVRQKKTGMPVRFDLSERTREAVDSYIKTANKKPGEFLFANRQNPERCMTTRQADRRSHPRHKTMPHDRVPCRRRLGPIVMEFRQRLRIGVTVGRMRECNRQGNCQRARRREQR